MSGVHPSRRVVLALALAGASILTVVPASSAPAPMLVAHRGGAALWPENTLTAFRNAHDLFKAAGVTGWLEMDTQFTSDHVLVVIHDATLDRTTNCSGPVVEKTYAQVSQCDADPAPEVFEPVPRLADVMSEGRAAGWRLMVEIKNIPGEPGFDADCHELADALVSDMRAAGFPTRDLIVESFWPFCLDRLEETAPAIATLLLTSSTTVNDITGIDTPVPLGFTLSSNALYATARGYEYSSPDDATVDLIGPVVDATHVLGRSVVVWTVDDASEMKELVGIGVDGIISNRPDLLISTFAG